MADNNSNFVYFDKEGVNYFQLYIKCPVCLEEFGQIEALEPIYWTHDYKVNGEACGGDIYVGDNAHYYCKKCGHTSHVVNWAYKCPKHSGDNDEYVSVSDLKYLASCLTVAAQITLGPQGVKWLRKFTIALDDTMDEA